MVLTLIIVTAVAALALGGVYEATKKPIENNKKEKLNNALKQVLPEFNNDVSADKYAVTPQGGGDELTFYPAKKDGELVGMAVETWSMQGYSGLIRIIVGFLPDGTINSISVLQHAETPGLGDKMEKSKSDWSKQFNDKNPENYNLKVTKDGGEVDAITAATITSRAYADAVQRAYDAFKNEMKGGE